MQFTVLDEQKQAAIYVETDSYSGVQRIVGKVAEDLKLVTEKEFPVYKVHLKGSEIKENPAIIFAATIGKSEILRALEEAGQIDLKQIRGKWECYQFQILLVTEAIKEKIPTFAGVKEILLIAGSDKRGTIYGLFHLSELIGVSPWVYWADVMPKKHKVIQFTESVNVISKEPSVKYRGFFINDEWPSFGNWTMEHFGGFTAEMYDHVFELLLRLKGNYLWPAMWSSSFSLDGPGLLSAELADEYGIVMSNSHHEPCLRHSEEWDIVRGKNSVYGDAWNFDQNREGLTAYWRDGLKRNGKFENIITIGMRGERDSKILGHDAGLSDNINYLKEVIETQNQLIRECIQEDLCKVPRMLALYKEVEAYYYGDEKTQGLADWEELDGVTLMLCDDNFGNMRTLPNEKLRDRKGGWGMYYHFDYHGEPVSYEWVNSTHLLKVWEQMGMAYEMGIRDIWIVNVGDLKPQELPLSFFLDLAYDFDTWGQKGASWVEKYTREWIFRQFASDFTEHELEEIYYVIEGYTKQNSIRKPEALRSDTYHPVHYREADRVLLKAEKLECIAESLEEKAQKFLLEKDGNARYSAFYELVYFPVMASMNLLKMQLYAGKNELYAKQGRISANFYADKISECIQKDRRLQEGYHQLANGKWNGMMCSEHIGFINWNDEDCRYPKRIYIEPANKPRMIVASSGETVYTTGEEWTRKKLIIRDFMDPYETKCAIDIANGSRIPFAFSIVSDVDWIRISVVSGEVEDTVRVSVSLERELLKKQFEGGGDKEVFTAHLQVKTSFSHVDIDIPAIYVPENVFGKPYVSELGLVLEASDHIQKTDGWNGKYITIPNLGKYPFSEKVFPVTESYLPGVDAPSMTYEFYLPSDGEYEITFLGTPSNSITAENEVRFGVQWGKEEIEIVNSLEDSYVSGESSCKQWAEGVLDQIHETRIVKKGKKGWNQLTVYACDAAYVLERILVIPIPYKWKKAYLGRRYDGTETI